MDAPALGGGRFCDEVNMDNCSLDAFVFVDVFDKSIKGKWTDRVSVGDFNGTTVCWENFPLSSRIPESDI